MEGASDVCFSPTQRGGTRGRGGGRRSPVRRARLHLHDAAVGRVVANHLDVAGAVAGQVPGPRAGALPQPALLRVYESNGCGGSIGGEWTIDHE